MSNYLAIDVGTEGVRAAVFDDQGLRLGLADESCQTNYPHAAWAEQDPEEWWRATISSVSAALNTAQTSKVDAIGIASTSSTVVFLDEEARPVRPAIMWMDSRASKQSVEVNETQHPHLKYSGGSVSSEWLLPKAMWVAENEFPSFQKARYIGESVDYIMLKLTGEWVGSRMNATCKWNFLTCNDGFPVDLYKELGVIDLLEKLPNDIRPVGSFGAQMSKETAKLMGIEGQPIVGIGGIDAHLSLISLSGSTRQPVSVVAGTSNAIVAEAEAPVFSHEVWGPYPDALNSGKWLIEGGQSSAGSVLSWVAESLLGYDRSQLGSLISRAKQVDPLSHGVLMLDNFMGNRTPLKDSLLRGAVFGLGIGTTPEELYCAAVEAVAFGTRSVIDSFNRAGVDTTDIYISGGIRHNRLWLESTANALDRPINFVTDENLTLVACACIAAVASGDAKSFASAAEAFDLRVELIEPSTRKEYREGYALYQAALRATADFQRELTSTANEYFQN